MKRPVVACKVQSGKRHLEIMLLNKFMFAIVVFAAKPKLAKVKGPFIKGLDPLVQENILVSTSHDI